MSKCLFGLPLAFPTVQENRYGARVDKLDIHHGAENACLHGQAFGPDQVAGSHEQRFRRIGLSGLNKGWSVAFATVAEQRELRHEQNSALNITKRPVHLAGFALKNAHVSNLPRDELRILVGIILLDAQEHEQARADSRADLVVYRNMCSCHSLDYSAQLFVLLLPFLPAGGTPALRGVRDQTFQPGF